MITMITGDYIDINLGPGTEIDKRKKEVKKIWR